MKKLGFILTTCDADSKHFGLILGEFTRLGYPFAVNFDHCCRDTKRLFQRHPLYLAGHENDNPGSHFNEAHRQFALDALLSKRNFDWFCCLDTDEVLDRRAPELIPQILEYDADLVWTPRIELWGDTSHYRADSAMYTPCMDPDCESAGGSGNLTDKFYNLQSGRWAYLHGTVHSAYLLKPKDDQAGKLARGTSGRIYADPIKTDWVQAPIRRKRSNLYTLHHLYADGGAAVDAAAHSKRWDAIYRQAVGTNPYSMEVYEYAARTPPSVLLPFDYDTFDGQ